MGDRLRLSDYLARPIVELPQFPDFDERNFWVASELNDLPMETLEAMLKEHKRASQEPAQAVPPVTE